MNRDEKVYGYYLVYNRKEEIRFLLEGFLTCSNFNWRGKNVWAGSTYVPMIVRVGSSLYSDDEYLYRHMYSREL